MELSGRSALVTGGGRGIGRATAVALARHGAKVCVVARSEPELVDAVAEVESMGGVAQAVVADVKDYDDCSRAIRVAREAFSAPIDIVVNNAGGGLADCPVIDSDPTEWVSQIEVNLVGVYNMCHAALPGMIDRGGGHIVNVGSGLGYSAGAGLSAYGSAKAAVAHFTRILAQEVWQHGIAVNEVIPGPVATRLTQGIFEIGKPAAMAPSERVKSPEEVAELMLWLVGQKPDGPTAQCFSLARRPLH